MKFRWEKRSTLAGGTEVVLTEASTITDPPTEPFELRADASGISIRGTSPMFYNDQDLESFAEVMGLAWSEHLALKKVLHEKLMGR